MWPPHEGPGLTPTPAMRMEAVPRDSGILERDGRVDTMAAHLAWREPEGPLAGVVLAEDGKHALHRAQDGPVNDDRPLRLADVFCHILHQHCMVSVTLMRLPWPQSFGPGSSQGSTRLLAYPQTFDAGIKRENFTSIRLIA